MLPFHLGFIFQIVYVTVKWDLAASWGFHLEAKRPRTKAAEEQPFAAATGPSRAKLHPGRGQKVEAGLLGVRFLKSKDALPPDGDVPCVLMARTDGVGYNRMSHRHPQ